MTDAYAVIEFPGWELPQNYQGLVIGKWLRSLRYGNDYFKLIDAGSYYKCYGTFIKSLLARPETRVWIAALVDDQDVSLGFSVFRGPTLDYVYVPREFRQIGIAKSLLPKGIKRYTHITNRPIDFPRPETALSLVAAKRPDWKFDPFA